MVKGAELLVNRNANSAENDMFARRMAIKNGVSVDNDGNLKLSDEYKGFAQKHRYTISEGHRDDCSSVIRILGKDGNELRSFTRKSNAPALIVAAADQSYIKATVTAPVTKPEAKAADTFVGKDPQEKALYEAGMRKDTLGRLFLPNGKVAGDKDINLILAKAGLVTPGPNPAKVVPAVTLKTLTGTDTVTIKEGPAKNYTLTATGTSETISLSAPHGTIPFVQGLITLSITDASGKTIKQNLKPTDIAKLNIQGNGTQSVEIQHKGLNTQVTNVAKTVLTQPIGSGTGATIRDSANVTIVASHTNHNEYDGLIIPEINITGTLKPARTTLGSLPTWKDKESVNLGVNFVDAKSTTGGSHTALAANVNGTKVYLTGRSDGATKGHMEVQTPQTITANTVAQSNWFTRTFSSAKPVQDAEGKKQIALEKLSKTELVHQSKIDTVQQNLEKAFEQLQAAQVVNDSKAEAKANKSLAQLTLEKQTLERAHKKLIEENNITRAKLNSTPEATPKK